MATTNPVRAASQQVELIVNNAIEKAIEQQLLPQPEQLPDFVVEIPGDTSHGDFATNVAMVGAKAFRMAPAKIAEIILSNTDFSDTWFEKAEIAGPGFINFFVSPDWFIQVVHSVNALAEHWGETDYGQGEKIMVEFVSANPTGPMHLGNARGGVIGDSLAAALNAAGFTAHREFYLNDAGNQIERFGLSLEVRYLQHFKGADAPEMPEDCYQGEDITQRAEEYIEKYGDNLLELSQKERQQALVDFALPLNVASMKETLEKYRIIYDQWFHESSLYEDGSVDKIIDILKDNGLTYEKDGALWYKATTYGAEKDEVLVRQNGNPTYFTADIAYHYNKLAVRGYEKAINIWGADHHGHVDRMKKALDAVNLDGNRLDVILMQMVRLMKDGEPFRMSKRTGKTVTLNDLLDMVPVDVVRFFFNMREYNSTMDFDLDLAVDESDKNPVHYVRYAHARICTLFTRAEERDIKVTAPSKEDLALLVHPSEIQLIRALAQYPEIIIGVTQRYDTASLTHYAVELASTYHKFYNDCRVLLDNTPENQGLIQARLALCGATRTTIANLLGLMKISAPISM